MNLIQYILFLSTVASSYGFTPNSALRVRVPTAIFSTTDASPNKIESNQEKYGKELELPNTYVRCGRCASSFAITEDDLGTGKGR